MSLSRVSTVIAGLRLKGQPFGQPSKPWLCYHRICKQHAKQNITTASSTAPRRLSFGKLETREDFRKVFGTSVHLPMKPDEPSQAGLNLTTKITDEAVSYLSSIKLAPALALSRSVLRIRNGKARYLVIYDTLKVFAKLARGRLILEARSVEEALADEQQSDEDEGSMAPFANTSRRQQKTDERFTSADTLLVGFEETLSDDKLLAPVEFLVYSASETAESGPIRFVCEAKPSLELYWGKATWQFLAKQTIAAQMWGSEEVYGALTDALEWHFFRIRKLPGDEWVIEAAMPLRLANSVFDATDESTCTVTMMWQCLFGKNTELAIPDLTGSLQAADEYMKKWAGTFTERAGRASALHKKDAEIQNLKAELERTKVQEL